MKTIRSLAGALLLLNGILHIIQSAGALKNPGSIGVMVFGIAYMVIGVLLYTPKRYPIYLGLIVPVIGMTLSIIKFGFPDVLSLSALFKIIGIVVVICCGYLLVRPER